MMGGVPYVLPSILEASSGVLSVVVLTLGIRVAYLSVKRSFRVRFPVITLALFMMIVSHRGPPN